MKSPLTQIILKIACTVMVIAAIFYFLVSPKLSSMVENQIEIERIGSDLKLADSKLSALKTAEKNRAALDTNKKEVFDLLPDDASASSFILNIESASSEVGIIVDSLSINEIKTAKAAKTTDTDTASADKTTTTTAAKKPAQEKALAFSASCTSDYDKAQAFLKRLELLSRFNTIESITLSNYRVNEGILNLQTDGKIYYGR